MTPRADLDGKLDMLHTPFMELGLTSLDMMELHSAIKTEVGGLANVDGTPMNPDNLSNTLVFDFPSLHHILSHICDSAQSVGAHSSAPPTDVDVDPAKPANSDEYAVIGISCRFPGGNNGPYQFYSSLCQGLDAIRLAPPAWQVPEVAKMLADGVTSSGPLKELLNESSTTIQQSQVLEQQLRQERQQDEDIETMYRQSETSLTGDNEEVKEEACYRYGGFLDDTVAETFDPIFFHISMAEAKTMDPHQRLLLEVCKAFSSFYSFGVFVFYCVCCDCVGCIRGFVGCKIGRGGFLQTCRQQECSIAE